MKKINLLILILLGVFNVSYGQFDAKYVETYTTSIDHETYSVVKMSRQDYHVKVKYFASQLTQDKSVYDRYREWSKGRKIILYSSGTYHTHDFKPCGLCIDNGTLINNSLRRDLGGLVIVQETGGMVATHLNDPNGINIEYKDGKKRNNLNITNGLQQAEFIKWAKSEKATVFQTNMFYWKNNMTVFQGGSKTEQERRFLAVAKIDGIVKHFIINLSGANTIYNATLKVINFLKKQEDADEIIFLLNLDTGMQDVYQVKTSNGSIDSRKGFSGQLSIDKAVNLLVYYYE